MNICVFCAASDEIDPAHKATAYTLGAEMGIKGHTLVFGGGAHGLMGEISRGVADSGGRVVGVIPEQLNLPGVASPLCDELFVTPDLASRRTMMAELADGFIALPGGFGTLEELLEMLTLKQLGLHDKPICVLDNVGYFDPLFMQFASAVLEGFAPLDDLKLYKVTMSVGETLRYMEEYTPEERPDRAERLRREMQGGIEEL